MMISVGQEINNLW